MSHAWLNMHPYLTLPSLPSIPHPHGQVHTVMRLKVTETLLIFASMGRSTLLVLVAVGWKQT